MQAGALGMQADGSWHAGGFLACKVGHHLDAVLQPGQQLAVQGMDVIDVAKDDGALAICEEVANLVLVAQNDALQVTYVVALRRQHLGKGRKFWQGVGIERQGDSA